MSKAELLAIVDAHTKKYGQPGELYDGTKNTLFGWTDDGKGVWVLPASKANIQRFEDTASLHPSLGQCELMRLAGAEFFADWRDSDRARIGMGETVEATGENERASGHPGLQ